MVRSTERKVVLFIYGALVMTHSPLFGGLVLFEVLSLEVRFSPRVAAGRLLSHPFHDDHLSSARVWFVTYTLHSLKRKSTLLGCALWATHSPIRLCRTDRSFVLSREMGHDVNE